MTGDGDDSRFLQIDIKFEKNIERKPKSAQVSTMCFEVRKVFDLFDKEL